MESPTSNGMSAIDPVQYGRLLASVEHQERQLHELKTSLGLRMDEMSSQITELLAMANKSKGGLWVGMSFAGVISSIATWFVAHFGSTKP
jgi:hypothetical protein